MTLTCTYYFLPSESQTAVYSLLLPAIPFHNSDILLQPQRVGQVSPVDVYRQGSVGMFTIQVRPYRGKFVPVSIHLFQC
ncbi:hypothetical protein SCLCIDRAFT_653184 [Scleroderma citrinum Foug A]|uniref:Uncharacterized protein n=1 Tax=Scleroderma citrinum Foug A TaxID=1036808 RepID=A0A0C3D5D0_9AGAM|nr:hypothetical protein SCLCIDRAFT_653184 [Scleroderma citrinum Foug A]